MSDDQLRSFGLKYGDLISLRMFLNTRSSQYGSTSSVDSGLLDRIRCKINDSMKSSNRKSMLMRHNKCAKKRCRRIEIGWLNYDTSRRRYFHVRPCKGGGTRHIIVNGTTTVSELAMKACTLFFPEGCSQYGRREDFDCEMLNFDESLIGNIDCTVEEIYEQKAVKMLRIYLATKLKDSMQMDSEPTQSTGMCSLQ